MLILGLLFGLLALSPLLALALLALANSERARALPRRIGERLWARPPSTPHNMQAAQAQIARGVDDTARQAHERESATSLPATE